MTRTINHQFFFPHPPATVWEYLTRSELLELWLMKNTFQPVVGADFQFRTGPIPNLDFDGVFYCKVLEIVPHQKLSYSWQTSPGDGKITLDSVVVWRLQATDKGTQLLLEHSGFDKEENIGFYKGLTDGWQEKLQKIDALLKTPQHGHTNA